MSACVKERLSLALETGRATRVVSGPGTDLLLEAEARAISGAHVQWTRFIWPLASSMHTRARGNLNDRTTPVMPFPEHMSSSTVPFPSAHTTT
eukprot:3417171-Rhodomonas_salina.1